MKKLGNMENVEYEKDIHMMRGMTSKVISESKSESRERGAIW